jgi:hypothetical protein
LGAPLIRDAELFAGGTISGRVTDLLGNPVEGMNVRSLSPFFGDTTDSNGEYGILVPAGMYNIEVTPGFTDFITPDPVPVVVVAGADPDPVDLALERYARVSGTVTDDATGAPIPGVFVGLASDDTGWSIGGPTDENGEYSARALPGTGYTLRSQSTEYADEYFDDVIDEASATVMTLTDAEQRTADAGLNPGGLILGTVTDAAATSLELIEVRVFTPGSLSVATSTAADGSYRIGGLESGNYTIRFTDPGGVFATEFYDDQPSDSTAEAVVVVDGGAAAIVNAELAIAGSISGTLRANGVLVSDGGVQACRLGVCESAIMMGDGTYTIDGLIPGDYLVSFRLNDDSLAWEYWNDVPGQIRTHAETFQGHRASTTTSG